MKPSAQVTITPLLLDVFKNAIDAMESYGRNPELAKATTRDDQVGDVIRAALTNNQFNLAILERFVSECKDKLDPQ